MTAKNGMAAGSVLSHLYHLAMSHFHITTGCPGYILLVWMMARTIDMELGRNSFQGADRCDLGSINELIPASIWEQSVTVRLHLDFGLRTEPNGLLKMGNGRLSGRKGPARKP